MSDQRNMILGIAACLLFGRIGSILAEPPNDDVPRAVSRQELLAAMRSHGDYDPTATTNGARFQAEVLLHLAREAIRSDPDDRPPFIGHEEWFASFLDVTGLAADEAPNYALLAYRHGQRVEISFRDGCVIREVKEGPVPELAANVVIWWPQTPGGPTRYSYRDTLSTPHLKVMNNRVITYRLLDLGDRIVYDQINGLTGRPTSGILGFLFRAIGEGRIVESAMAVSEDGLQVARARASKAFLEVSTTVTVYPDGRTEKDVPKDRPDLLAIEARLKEPSEIEYAPLRFSDR